MRYRQAFALTLTLALLIGLAGPGQAQKALKIFMIPKFTGAAYFAATEKGAKDAVAEMKARVAKKYPAMKLVDIRYGLDKPAESFSVAQDLINKYRGQLDAIIAPTSVALPKVAEAAEQAGLAGKIVVTGLSTPNDMREFVKKGTVKTVVLWNPVDLGYLAVYVAHATITGTLKEGMAKQSVRAGRLGTREATAQLNDITAKGPLTLRNVILLGAPFRFTKENIDRFNF